MMRSIIAALIISVSIAPSAMAHGGGLDSKGGHNCYVRSCAGDYHHHRGGGGSGSSRMGSHADKVFAAREAKPRHCPFPFTLTRRVSYMYWLLMTDGERCEWVESLTSSAQIVK